MAPEICFELLCLALQLQYDMVIRAWEIHRFTVKLIFTESAT